HRVDHADLGTFALERRADRVELRLGQDADVAGAAEPVRAQLHLSDGLLAGDEQTPSSRAHSGQGAEEQRRLADAGLAADEHERGGHETAAEHAVELGDTGRDALGFVGLDVDEAQERAGRRGMLTADEPLDQRSERAAARAAAEPAPGNGAALAARMLNRCRLRHDGSGYAQVPTATV